MFHESRFRCSILPQKSAGLVALGDARGERRQFNKIAAIQGQVSHLLGMHRLVQRCVRALNLNWRRFDSDFRAYRRRGQR